MANVKESLDRIMQTEGALGACVVDSSSGMMLGSIGGGPQFNVEVAAAGNTDYVGLDKTRANLAMARFHLADIEKQMQIS